MPIIKHPAILTDLGHVGERGLPLNNETWFQSELELCREWGFPLKMANGRVGLQFDQESLVPYWIQQETPAIAWDWLRVNGYLCLDSTNREAFDLARKGAPNGTLVYAEEQTDGKGRKGRTWFSQSRAGLFFSLILRPGQARRWWPLLTHVACVSLIEALKALSESAAIPQPLNIDLKWPNDVLLDGKKCAGILLEALPLEGKNSAAIVGVGINVHSGSVPESLIGEATCIDDMAGIKVPRRKLLIHFLRQFQLNYRAFEEGKHADILDKWKSMSSMWNGVPVTIVEGKESRRVVTCGLDEIGALLIHAENGSIEKVYAGDLRIRRDE
jgi:BirA family transcriptional regulator, biotin operon repressor / biotin---[acetyl-CoA-carboxylase] ligase